MGHPLRLKSVLPTMKQTKLKYSFELSGLTGPHLLLGDEQQLEVLITLETEYQLIKPSHD